MAVRVGKGSSPSMDSLVLKPLVVVPPRHRHHHGSVLGRCWRPPVRLLRLPASVTVASNGALAAKSLPNSNGEYTVGDFMTRKENLLTVKPYTSVDEALELLVKNRISGFPVIDDDWKLVYTFVPSFFLFSFYSPTKCSFLKLARASIFFHLCYWHMFDYLSSYIACLILSQVGVVSDYDLLALDSISGSGRTEISMFPEVDSSWKTFNEIQKLLSKTNGQVVGEVMTRTPLAVRESTDLEDAARLLLETKYRRFPVVDGNGKVVGIITRGTVVRAALRIKHRTNKNT
ncbi:CBS domain-containing protein CBSX1, chloroplastic-like isoform X1 [Zingiber officinale]|uniref:CBS domain-containing protein CBSX1, chloroplastic-like isoform X1 n=1 Tax=Zingiber officinale TaxID=94328 RepID=UPI001C4D54FF|nr:CBS domain-containing protein CBSX1, chloroplastic-like isoform X1 [Zingiber officinale]